MRRTQKKEALQKLARRRKDPGVARATDSNRRHIPIGAAATGTDPRPQQPRASPPSRVPNITTLPRFTYASSNRKVSNRRLGDQKSPWTIGSNYPRLMRINYFPHNSLRPTTTPPTKLARPAGNYRQPIRTSAIQTTDDQRCPWTRPNASPLSTKFRFRKFWRPGVFSPGVCASIALPIILSDRVVTTSGLGTNRKCTSATHRLLCWRPDKIDSERSPEESGFFTKGRGVFAMPSAGAPGDRWQRMYRNESRIRSL